MALAVQGWKRHIGWPGLVLLLAGGLLLWLRLPSTLFGGGTATVLLLASVVLLVAHCVFNWSRVRLFSRSRTSRYGATALLYTLAVGGILVVLNLLAARHDWRHDTTAERFHSLSPQTERVLGDLDAEVEVLAFLGRNHPGRPRAEDLLGLMEAASDGRLRYELIDPVLEPQRAREHEVQRPTEIVAVTERGTDRTSEITEPALVNTVLEAAMKERPVVCFSRGHGERNIDSTDQTGYRTVADALRRERYVVVDLLVQRTDDLPDRCTVLVVAGPSRPFLGAEAERVAELLAAGGGLLVLAEPETPTGLDTVLTEQGIRLGDDQVVETTRLEGFGYLNPLGVDYAQHPITAPLHRSRLTTVYFDARSAQPHEDNVYRPEIDAECLVETGRRGSYAESEPGVISFDPDEDREGPICLGTAGVHDPHEAPVQAGESPPPSDTPTRRAVAFGDADFANNFYASMGGNTEIFLNSVGWLARRGELLEMRSPDRVARTILLEASQVRLLVLVSVIALPAVILLGGLGVWLRRRKL